MHQLGVFIIRCLGVATAFLPAGALCGFLAAIWIRPRNWGEAATIGFFLSIPCSCVVAPLLAKRSLLLAISACVLPVYITALIAGKTLNPLFAIGACVIHLLLNGILICCFTPAAQWVARPGHCPECDYDLRLLKSDRCPECGSDLSGVDRARKHDGLRWNTAIPRGVKVIYLLIPLAVLIICWPMMKPTERRLSQMLRSNELIGLTLPEAQSRLGFSGLSLLIDYADLDSNPAEFFFTYSILDGGHRSVFLHTQNGVVTAAQITGKLRGE